MRKANLDCGEHVCLPNATRRQARDRKPLCRTSSSQDPQQSAKEEALRSGSFWLAPATPLRRACRPAIYFRSRPQGAGLLNQSIQTRGHSKGVEPVCGTSGRRHHPAIIVRLPIGRPAWPFGRRYLKKASARIPGSNGTSPSRSMVTSRTSTSVGRRAPRRANFGDASVGASAATVPSNSRPG